MEILKNIVANDLAESFYLYLKQLGYSSKNCRHQYKSLLNYLCWLESRGEDLQTSNQQSIKDYKSYLQSRTNKRYPSSSLNPKTIYGYLKTLEHFYRLNSRQGIIEQNPFDSIEIKHPKVESVERIVLSRSEIKALYQAADTYRKRALLSLAYGCGLRCKELENCNTEDILLKERLLVVPRGKGTKRRVIPLSTGVEEDIKNYLYLERPKLTQGRNYREGEKALILNTRGSRMKAWTYNKELKKLIDASQQGNLLQHEISIHNLRHSIATHLLEQGVPLQQVRQFLGHSQLETTQIYTRVSQKQLKELIEL